jgi:hypothetical protein
MRRIMSLFLACMLIVPLAALAQEPTMTTDDNSKLRQEVEQLKKTLAELEKRLDVQERKPEATPAETPKAELEAQVKDIDQRVTKQERDAALNRVRFSGDFRFEAHSILGTIPEHFDGMTMQNLLVRTLFVMNANGGAMGPLPPNPADFKAFLDGYVATHYGDYQYFTNNLTFAQLKSQFNSFPPAMQQQLMGYLMPLAHVNKYDYNNSIMYTNRLRLNLDSQLSDNVSFTGRLSMYKTFGDSTGAQVFNGQPNSLNIDGNTTRVPNSDILRVERAYFTWSKIAGTPFYLSIGRRPSTDGPPMNLRQDEPRGGTPMGSLIDYQFDGITAGYHVGENTTLRICYGLGYEAGFGNGDLLKQPQDRLSDVHFLGGNIDLWATDKTLLQVTFAKAFDVTDGFNGSVVFPVNPLTGDPIPNFVMRFTPSTNLGDIGLAGFVAQRRVGKVDVFGNVNWVGTRPRAGVTTAFGGLMSDPFENPTNRDGYMVYFGGRLNLGPEDRTKVGFEFNHGSKYWFNFAQGADDIIAPKTSARGNVYETYLTHRITRRFIFKADYINYDYQWSGSGWHIGAPKDLNTVPLLGFPTYKKAQMFTIGLTARF